MAASPDGALSGLQRSCLQAARIRLATRFDLAQVLPRTDHYIEAWELTVNLEICERVSLQFTKRFPFELPRLFLLGPSRHGELSHVAPNGHFCYVDDSGISYPIDRIADAVEEALDKSLAALSDPATLKSEDEFRKELFFYLPISGRFYSLLDDLSAPRTVSVLRLHEDDREKVRMLFAETEEQGRRWIANAGLADVDSVEEAAFLPDAFPGRPPFPTTVGGLFSFLKRENPEAARFAVRQARKVCTFLTSVGSSLGPSVLAWQQRKSRFTTPRTSPAIPGFRPGKYPAEREILVDRKDEPLTVYRGERIDLGRLAQRTEPGLAAGRARRVVLVGAGSVGSNVIDLIFSAALCTSLDVFDSDELKPENVLRHRGDWSDVGYPKSFVTAIALRRKHPHVSFDCHTDAIAYHEKFISVTASADLVVLATGSGEIDQFLAEAAHRTGKRGIVTAQIWVESEAERGHLIVHVKGIMPCPSCSRVERAKLDLAGLHQEPGCGGAYANYGGSRLQRFLAIAADYCINGEGPFHLTWHARSGSPSSVDNLGIARMEGAGCSGCSIC